MENLYLIRISAEKGFGRVRAVMLALNNVQSILILWKSSWDYVNTQSWKNPKRQQVSTICWGISKTMAHRGNTHKRIVQIGLKVKIAETWKIIYISLL